MTSLQNKTHAHAHTSLAAVNVRSSAHAHTHNSCRTHSHYILLYDYQVLSPVDVCCDSVRGVRGRVLPEGEWRPRGKGGKVASPTPSGGCCWPANWDRKEAGSAPASPWPEGEASAREDNTPAVVSGDREKGELLSISSRVDEWKSSVPIPLRFSSFGEDDGFSLVCIPLEAPSEPVQPAPFFTAASSWPSRVDILNCEFEFCPTRYQLKVIDCSQGSETWSAPGLVYMYGRYLETKRRPVAPLRNPWILLYDSLKEGSPLMLHGHTHFWRWRRSGSEVARCVDNV